MPANAVIMFEHLDMGSERILVLNGTFAFEDDPAALAAEVAAFRPTFISFDSGGGNVAAAMRFGRAIRQMNLTTMQIRSADCASACTLTFMGGVRRFAEPGAIGVHQASFAGGDSLDGPSAVAAVQAMTAEIMTYMIEMGVDPQLMQLSLATHSSDMRYLTASEMQRYRVTTGADGDPGATALEGAFGAPAAAVRPAPDAPPQEGMPDVVAFLQRLQAAWSRPNGEAMAFVRDAYAERVSYFGKLVSRATVLKEKETFTRRWPIRAYSIRPGSEIVQCGTICRVEAIMDWHARSEERGKTASGIATIEIEWNPATGKIVSENSRVLKAERASDRAR